MKERYREEIDRQKKMNIDESGTERYILYIQDLEQMLLNCFGKDLL